MKTAFENVESWYMMLNLYLQQSKAVHCAADVNSL